MRATPATHTSPLCSQASTWCGGTGSANKALAPGPPRASRSSTTSSAMKRVRRYTFAAEPLSSQSVYWRERMKESQHVECKHLPHQAAIVSTTG